VTPELTRARDAYFVTFNMREGQSFRFGDITVVSEIAEIDRTPMPTPAHPRGRDLQPAPGGHDHHPDGKPRHPTGPALSSGSSRASRATMPT
jgi:hypothetical protein